MLVSKKLRALMDLIAIEAPTARIAGSGQGFKLFYAPLGIVTTG
jgi:hypothetical protein